MRDNKIGQKNQYVFFLKETCLISMLKSPLVQYIPDQEYNSKRNIKADVEDRFP